MQTLINTRRSKSNGLGISKDLLDQQKLIDMNKKEFLKERTEEKKSLQSQIVKLKSQTNYVRK